MAQMKLAGLMALVKAEMEKSLPILTASEVTVADFLLEVEEQVAIMEWLEPEAEAKAVAQMAQIAVPQKGHKHRPTPEAGVEVLMELILQPELVALEVLV